MEKARVPVGSRAFFTIPPKEALWINAGSISPRIWKQLAKSFEDTGKVPDISDLTSINFAK